MLDWSLLHGALPFVIGVTGAVGAVVLLLPRGGGRRWWGRTVPIALVTAVLLAALTVLVARVGFATALPRTVAAWTAGALAAVTLAVAGRRAGGRIAVVVPAALVMTAAAASGVNHYYGEVPTIRTALGLGYPDQIAFTSVPSRVPVPIGRWVPPTDVPAVGRVAEVDIPGTYSGFDARRGWVYLPPAYLGGMRAQLPVLVLLAGQPGGPSDWLDGGRLAGRMDRYAAAHHGLAPVVLMPDDLGSEFADPQCLNPPDPVTTYLSVDVPAWIERNLQVGPARAVAGISYGGTCALRLALTEPSVYPTFLDIAGDTDAALLDLLAGRPHPGTEGAVVVGRQDPEFGSDAATAAMAALDTAGIPAHMTVLPGAHTWSVWGPGLEAELPWLGAHLGIPP